MRILWKSDLRINHDMLGKGGGAIWPPPFPCLISKYALLLESAIKCPKNDKIYIFKKPLTMSFQICQNSCNNSNNSMCNQEKLECANFFWRAVCKQFAKKSLQNLCNPFPYVNGFQKDKNIKIRQLYVGQNKDLVCYWKE